MVSTLVLDVDALTLLRELLDDVPLPRAFTSVRGQDADPALVAAAREAAGRRLRDTGLLVPETLSGNDSQEIVHPSLRAALEGFGRAGLRIEVRSWAGDRAVVADLAIGGQAGVGLTRLQRVTPGPDPEPPQDALGVELAIFESDDVLTAVERLLPPAPTRVQDPPVPAESLRLNWPDGLALLALLRRRDTITTDQLPVAREVLRLLLDSAGLSAVPPLLDRLAEPLEAAVRITLSAPGRADGAVWFGYWVQCGGQLIGLRTRSGPEPEPGTDVVLDLVPTDGPGLQADLLLALTGALLDPRLMAAANGPGRGGRR